MKRLLQSEDWAGFLAACALWPFTGLAWWWLPALFLTPDLAMLGYLAGPRAGAAAYNLAHHQGLALLCAVFGVWLRQDALLAAGLLLYGHSRFDRAMGYGLKYASAFHDTHLGRIGRRPDTGEKP